RELVPDLDSDLRERQPVYADAEQRLAGGVLARDLELSGLEAQPVEHVPRETAFDVLRPGDGGEQALAGVLEARDRAGTPLEPIGPDGLEPARRRSPRGLEDSRGNALVVVARPERALGRHAGHEPE